MLRRFVPVAWVLMAGWGSWSCADSKPEDDAATFDPDLLPARADYRTHCSACHGKNGAGAETLFPPLRGSGWVNGNAEVPIRVVLHGLQGPLIVEGEKFMNKMAPLGRVLNDEELARILTYVRASWGNEGAAVSEAEVARVRAATADRKESWTENELKPLLNAGGP